MSDNVKTVLLIGAGPMAIEYAKVLKAQKVDFIVIGRGKESAKIFHEKTNVNVFTGGIEHFFTENKANYSKAIVATGVEELSETAKKLMEKGITNLLLEKPGGLYKEKLIELENLSKKKKANVLIAYNRRFYSSVLEAQNIIKKDGGVLSFQFDFTEWSHIIEKIQKPDIVKQRWFLSNSTHVADMAFFLGGKPKEMESKTMGTLNWHTSASIFVGSGISETESGFSYTANWISPGRWSIEIMTQNFRLIFKPLEQLAIQKKGSVTIEQVSIDDSLDKQFKPGVYRMTECFLKGDYNNICHLHEQINMFDVYSKMANYN